MKVASSFNTDPDTTIAVKEAYTNLVTKLGNHPTWMAVHGTYQHSGELITEVLQNIAPDVPFQGGTSCLGVMTETGFHSENGISFGLFGIYDPEGTYNVGYSEPKSFTRQSGRDAIIEALENAPEGKEPSLVWITCAPGDEEGILAGMEEGLGRLNVPIVGGSTADNDIEGKWYQITNNQVLHNGIVATVMYTSKPVHRTFESSYKPTEHKGIITKASGRTVYEINRRPAAEVYNEWTNGLISDYLAGGNILEPSTLYPIGRSSSMWSPGTTFYQLSHPVSVLENQALTFFTEINRGEQIVLMEGSRSDLVYSIGDIASKTTRGNLIQEKKIAGALVIYCAGCMLSVQDDMQEVSQQFTQLLGEKPFLGLHTFGEQGRALGEHCHANLMVSMVVFEE